MLATLAVVLTVAVSLPAAVAQEAPAEPAEPPQTVSGAEISMLIRGTMVALHHANITGNYSVLRELGSVRFQASNSPARLTDLFREFRERRMNLAPTVIYDAKLDGDPELSTNGVLRLYGHFPTKPQEIIFDLTFLFERDDWRIASLNVGTRAATAANGPASEEVAAAGPGGPPMVPIPPVRPQ